VSMTGISLTPLLLPSVPKLLTLIRVIDFLIGSTSLRIPSYRTNALVINEILLPKMLPDWSPPELEPYAVTPCFESGSESCSSCCFDIVMMMLLLISVCAGLSPI
jgi:hypothetical protein